MHAPKTTLLGIDYVHTTGTKNDIGGNVSAVRVRVRFMATWRRGVLESKISVAGGTVK